MHKPTAISITAASALLLTVGGFGGGGGGDGGSGGVSNSGFLFHCRSSFPSFFLFLFFFFTFASILLHFLLSANASILLNWIYLAKR